jgi:hypothetical protein
MNLCCLGVSSVFPLLVKIVSDRTRASVDGHATSATNCQCVEKNVIIGSNGRCVIGRRD